MFVAECAGESGPGREGQGPAAADGAGCQRAGSEGLCQTLSDPAGEEKFLIHRWNHLDFHILKFGDTLYHTKHPMKADSCLFHRLPPCFNANFLTYDKVM